MGLPKGVYKELSCIMTWILLTYTEAPQGFWECCNTKTLPAWNEGNRDGIKWRSPISGIFQAGYQLIALLGCEYGLSFKKRDEWLWGEQELKASGAACGSPKESGNQNKEKANKLDQAGTDERKNIYIIGYTGWEFIEFNWYECDLKKPFILDLIKELYKMRKKEKENGTQSTRTLSSNSCSPHVAQKQRNIRRPQRQRPKGLRINSNHDRLARESNPIFQAPHYLPYASEILKSRVRLNNYWNGIFHYPCGMKTWHHY